MSPFHFDLTTPIMAVGVDRSVPTGAATETGNGKRIVTTPERSRDRRSMDFVVIGEITDIEIIAVDSSIREVARLRWAYGAGRWRRLEGTATLRLFDG